MSHTGRVLAIDYGLRRCGMALSSPMNMFATPLDTIENKSETYLIEVISKLILGSEISKIVLGLPIRTTGEEAKEAKRVRAFGEKLKNKFKLEVAYEDERYTSTIAQQSLRALGKKPSQDKGSIDQTAAMLILQSHLDRCEFQKNRLT